MKGEGCGFILELSQGRIYISGDTGMTEEMGGLKGIDVAILPLCDNVYLRPSEVLRMVRAISPRVFIPVHYTPMNEPDPEIKEGVYYSKDVRFYTKREDPSRLYTAIQRMGIEMVVLRKLVPPPNDEGNGNQTV